LVVALWPTSLDEPAGEEVLRRAVVGYAASDALIVTSELGNHPDTHSRGWSTTATTFM
jgi:hypothetical protein